MIALPREDDAMELLGSPAYLAFLALAVVLIVTPGPSVLLIVSASLNGGLRRGLVTVAGTGVGMLGPLAVAVVGATTVAGLLAGGLTWLRWLGVAWLVFQGITELRRRHQPLPPGRASGAGPGPPGTARAFWQGLTVSLLNPTTTPFFFAFLPQFVDDRAPVLPQLALLAVSFLLVAAVLDCCWAVAAARVGHRLAGSRFAGWRGRITGGLLLACGLGLALARLD